MEFSVDLLSFQKAMRLFGAVAKATSLETDGQLFLEIRDTGELVVLCSNKSISLTHVIPKCEVVVAGSAAVLYGKLSPFVFAFPYLKDGVGAKTISFKALKNDLALQVVSIINDKPTTHKLKLRLYPVQKIAFPSPFGQSLFEINAATLRLALSKVMYAVNPSAIRSFLQGVNLNFDKDYVYFAGTDAQKLSEYRTPNTSKFLEGAFTLSYPFINALKRILDTDSTVYFCVDNNRIKARFGNTVLHGLLLLGEEYPDYTKAFENYTQTITLNKHTLISSLAPVIPSLDPDDHSRLTIQMSGGKLVLKNDFAAVEYSEDIKFDGDFVIDLNGTYLIQTLNAIMDDLITMQFSTDTSALIFDSAQFNNQKALITPVRRHG